MQKRENRETAFLLIYEQMSRTDTPEEIAAIAKEIEDIKLTAAAEKLFFHVVEKQEELDRIISNYSNKRTVSRIPKVNTAILRLALYEALYQEKVPINVAISEAVILANKYADDADAAFINGVLGAFSRDLAQEQPVAEANHEPAE